MDEVSDWRVCHMGDGNLWRDEVFDDEIYFLEGESSILSQGPLVVSIRLAYSALQLQIEKTSSMRERWVN